METAQPSGSDSTQPARAVRRIVDNEARMRGLMVGDRDPNFREIFNIMSYLHQQPGIDVAGREVLYRDVVATGEDADGRIETKLISAVFRLCQVYFPIWCTTEHGVDEEGPYEKGFNVYFTAYIPIPRYYHVGDDTVEGEQWMLRWVKELAQQELGVELVPVSEPLKETLSEDWSAPVQVRIEGGELVFRAMRHPVMGTEQDPLDRIWLTID